MDLGSPNYWTQRRKELLSWFNRNAPSLGELYEGAVEMVFRDRFPGRVRFVAHAVREIRNRLPDAIAGQKIGGQLQYKNRLDEIAKIWEEYGLPLDGSVPLKVTEEPSLPSSDSVPSVPVPIPIYKEVATLIRGHVRTRETPREAAERLFEAIDPNNSESKAALRPRIENWINVTEWFVKRAHDRGETDAKMGEKELRKRFETFETALFALIGEFFETLEDLDEILEEANS